VTAHSTLPTQDHLGELDALARLAHTLATATADVGSPGAHAMAQALATRRKTLAAGIRLATPQDSTKLGFKMVKYLRSIELFDDYRKVGEGQGGVREDEQQYDMGAEI
jgi:hypothetical protein